MKIDPDSLLIFSGVNFVALLIAPAEAVLLAMPLQFLAAVLMDTYLWPWLWGNDATDD